MSEFIVKTSRVAIGRTSSSIRDQLEWVRCFVKLMGKRIWHKTSNRFGLQRNSHFKGKKKGTKTKRVENSRFKSYRKKLCKIDTFYNSSIFIYFYFRKSNLKEAGK